MQNSPLISIVILNYKRLDALKRTLKSILCQTYSSREIIVVDNHSEDRAQEVVTEIDPSIRFIALSRNEGSCAGRNAGIREADGEILVFLDNDVSFMSPFDLENVIRVFNEHPEVHVLTFKSCQDETGELRLREWCHPKNWNAYADSEFETDFFIEGSSAFRREVFEKTGLYYEPLFIGHEGLDLVLRVLNMSFRVLYAPRIKVIHLAAKETRMADRTFYYYTRNYIWIAYRNYGVGSGLRFLVPKLAMMLYFALRTGMIRHFARGIRDGTSGLPALRPERNPISKSTLRYLAALSKGRPSLAMRFSKHRTAPQV
ncbi:MAG TPA: glycosyltransferase family 2 protein [Candidatus Acidoferrales bacterium]|nr:glycosyltransferase family 2 protein [Candidatus Acidoferrales bacterium]